MMTQTTGRLAPDAKSRVLVDPQWLDDHLRDPHVRVVEVDVSAAAYDDWHIDGAVLWNVYGDLKDADYRTSSGAELEDLMRRSGIDGGSTVVFYGYAPCFGFWLLTYYGHRDVRILDCSRAAWRGGGHPWTTRPSEASVGTVRLAAEDPAVRADRAAVRAAIDRPTVALLDVRSADEYRGQRFWPSGAMDPQGRAGHVPSAVHQPLDDLLQDDGSFRPVADLRRVFSAVDFTDDVHDGGTELITYCTIGGRAATAWFVLTQLLGRERVRVYDGSWAEWGRLPDTPIARSDTG